MADALQSALTRIGLAIGRLTTIKTPAQGVAFMRELGFEIPQASFGPALPALATQAGNLKAAIAALAAETDAAAIAGAAFNLMSVLRSTVDAIGQLRAELEISAGAVPNIGELPRRLFDYLLLDYLAARLAAAHGVMHLLGLVEHEESPAPGQPARTLHWNRFGQMLSEPGRIFNDVYGWEANFDFPKFLTRLEAMMRAVGLPGGIYMQSDAARAALGSGAALEELRVTLLQKGFTPATYSQFGVTISPAEAQGGAKAGFAIFPFITGASAFAFDVCDRGELTFESTGDIRGVGIVVRPPLSAQGVMNLVGSFRASLHIREKASAAQEIILLGSAGGSRLSLQGLGVNWFVDGSHEQLDLGMGAEINALRLVIAPGEGDGFLQKALSGVNVDVQTALAFGMSLASGFTFRGGAKLALELGVHLELGPVHVDRVRLAIEPSTEGLGLETGACLKFDLGPMKAVVENLGLRAKVRFQPGNLGPADFSLGFMPPNGVGLSLDAGGFKGGGFLRFDSEKGEYAGALELDFNGFVTVKAVGIINTKMPDGSEGYSLLILISAEFTPIQLSFGFTLNGVGGLFGLNRTIFVNALVDGIRTNAIKSILFPDDVIANITRIISDIKQFFPPEEGHFVVGPMAKLGWGTPTIITAELGLLLDLPRPMFAIVGVLRAMLPAEDAPILRLQVNFIGILDFDRGYLFFRADLYDSRLLTFSITGSMAFLVSWGDEGLFALSVGGFHPDFRDVPAIPALPDGFRNMARIGISLLADDNPRLKIESYFAVTSNTVQFGARVELYAAAAGFNVYGFLGYDVLFQFDPFRFIAKFYAGIALRHDDDVIAGINIAAQLAGPNPWDARGTASLSILFFDIEVDFHVTWGDPPPAIEPATEDLLALLKKELADTRNWRAELPPENHLHVSVRAIEPRGEEAPLVIHPAGVVTFSERSLPLEDYLIEKYGTRKPLDLKQFKLSNANANGLEIPADFQGVREEFATSQFSEMSDNEKLSRRSFEKLPSGFSLSAASNLAAGMPVTRDVIYELSYLHDEPARSPLKSLVKLATAAYATLVKGSAVRQSALAQQQTRVSLNAPETVVLPPETFVVASTEDLRAYAAAGEAAPAFRTEAEAYQHRQALIAANPALADQIQVVSHFELAA